MMVQYHYEKSATLRRTLWLVDLGLWVAVILMAILYTQDQADQSGEGWNWVTFLFVLLFNPLHWAPGILTIVLGYLALMRLGNKNGDGI